MSKKNSIEKIRNRYSEKMPSKTQEIKALDKKITRPVYTRAYVFGSIAALVFGGGMALSLDAVKVEFPDWVGIAVGVFGMFLCWLNYVAFKKSLKRRKKKYASEILKLCDEAERGE